jgi:hypothetical protein
VPCLDFLKGPIATDPLVNRLLDSVQIYSGEFLIARTSDKAPSIVLTNRRLWAYDPKLSTHAWFELATVDNFSIKNGWLADTLTLRFKDGVERSLEKLKSTNVLTDSWPGWSALCLAFDLSQKSPADISAVGSPLASTSSGSQSPEIPSADREVGGWGSLVAMSAGVGLACGVLGILGVPEKILFFVLLMGCITLLSRARRLDNFAAMFVSAALAIAVGKLLIAMFR